MEETQNRIDEVYEVFKEYFGEDKVDLHRHPALNQANIWIWFPRVTVTNEHDESIEITDLYIKVKIANNGTIVENFTMTRGSYPLSQVRMGYIHSHGHHIPHNSNETTTVCLGSGPLVRTISILSLDCDLDRWNLFCYELDKYVQVESEIGIPYHHLNQVTRTSLRMTEFKLDYEDISGYNFTFPEILIRPFIPYLVEKDVLHFTHKYNHWYIGHSFIEYLEILTTTLKEYIIDNGLQAETFFNSGVLIKGFFRNGKFLTASAYQGRDIYSNPEGRVACTFKGRDVIITVTNDLLARDDSRDIIVQPTIANYLLYKILNVLNYGSHRTESSSTQEEGTIII